MFFALQLDCSNISQALSDNMLDGFKADDKRLQLRPTDFLRVFPRYGTSLSADIKEAGMWSMDSHPDGGMVISR